MANLNLPVLEPEERVLSTLDNDGTRRWLYPKLSTGRFWHRRRVVAYLLIALYAMLPWIDIGGRPALQLDFYGGRLCIFGLVLRPTEFQLVALGAILVFVVIFFATAIFGRVWCGWACPQTVYMEYVFRPIERLFLGAVGKGGKPKKEVAPWRRVAMYAVMLLICWHLCNTFLAYFVGARTLNEWIWTAPPWEHPGAFALVLVVTALMMFDFCYWREQLCIIGCPYGRFQSVLLDRSSLIVGYDEKRGEPRGRGRDREAKGLGDCVNCGMCIDVCPTGIDIRDGLQMECVNCTQCIDACDAVMDKVGKPRGLIRYSSQSGLDGDPTRILRPRVLAYGGVIGAVALFLVVLLIGRQPLGVSLLSGAGRPYYLTDTGDVRNIVRVKLTNRLDRTQTVSVEAVEPAGIQLEGFQGLEIPPLGDATEPIQLVMPRQVFVDNIGVVNAVLRITTADGATIDNHYPLIGPRNPLPAAEAKHD